MKHPHLTSLAGAVLIGLGSFTTAQAATVKATVTGKISNATSSLMPSATASATQIGPPAAATNSMQVTFVDPLSPMSAEWSAGIAIGSQGYHSTICRTWGPRELLPTPIDGQPPYQCRDQVSNDPPWKYGTGPQHSGASGKMTYQAGAAIPGYRPGEVQFRALDAGAVGSEHPSLSARSNLAQGRTTTSAVLEFQPGLAGWLEPPSCKGDLVIEIRYGIDGWHSDDPGYPVSAHRWLDLDLNYTSNVFRPTSKKWGRVAIRAEGQSKTAPQRAGWPVSTGVTRSNIFIDTSEGMSTIDTIDWKNGPPEYIGSGPAGQWFNSWKTHTLRIPVTVGSTTRFNLSVSTHQSTHLQRTVPGGVEVPATSLPVMGPLLGNGVDLRMYLENMRAIDSKTPAANCRLPA